MSKSNIQCCARLLNPPSINKKVELSYQKLIAALARLKFSCDDSINAHNIWKEIGKLGLPFDMDIGNIRARLEPAVELLNIDRKRKKV